jgi:hypothetical protein
MLVQKINRYTLLTSDISEFKNYVDKIELLNGGNDPEEWFGGNEICANEMNWEKGIRIIIHIADDPAHSPYIMLVKTEVIILLKGQD